MNPAFASDLAFMHADSGVPVVWGAYRTVGILSVSTADQVNSDGYAIVRGETPVLAYPAAALPGLKSKEILQIAGADYLVNHVDLLEDGLRAHAYLERQ